MSGLIGWLEEQNARDTKARAVLRRSLAFEPGTHVPSYPYVEPFVRNADESRRAMHYLVAGLWAAHWRESQPRQGLAIGIAAASHWRATGSASTERRFINLLDADKEQLPNRLRQMLALLKEQPIDFDMLLRGLLYWNDDQKRTQTQWARDFYRAADDAEPTDLPSTDGASQ